jgi:hypothetical protein
MMNDHNVFFMPAKSSIDHGPTVRVLRGKMGSHRSDRFAGYGQDPSRNPTITYEEKVRLFHAKRYLMPLPPLGTRNWTVRDYIRYIDQHGRWCPDGGDRCELPDESTLGQLHTSLKQPQSVESEDCPYCGNIIVGSGSKCSRCGYCVLCG